MKGNKLYTTKEMKPAAVEDAADIMSSYQKESTHTIQEKRGRYIVRDIEGKRLGVFFNKKDAEDFIK
jgi:hypothetical protein